LYVEKNPREPFYYASSSRSSASVAKQRPGCSHIASHIQLIELVALAWKVAVVVCMRMLLTDLNAMIRHRLSWNELQIVKNLTAP
jgi:hypothetical protein